MVRGQAAGRARRQVPRPLHRLHAREAGGHGPYHRHVRRAGRHAAAAAARAARGGPDGVVRRRAGDPHRRSELRLARHDRGDPGRFLRARGAGARRQLSARSHSFDFPTLFPIVSRAAIARRVQRLPLSR
ncbi:hypothetical protein BGLA2_2340005 [Burkholderia gladioli]|nr:hypothetical protein BGLA2_2340005 [Burkholderia gladioli]